MGKSRKHLHQDKTASESQMHFSSNFPFRTLRITGPQDVRKARTEGDLVYAEALHEFEPETILDSCNIFISAFNLRLGGFVCVGSLHHRVRGVPALLQSSTETEPASHKVSNTYIRYHWSIYTTYPPGLQWAPNVLPQWANFYIVFLSFSSLALRINVNLTWRIMVSVNRLIDNQLFHPILRRFSFHQARQIGQFLIQST